MNINEIIERNVPQDMFVGFTTEQKLFGILNVWKEMRDSNHEYQTKFDGLFKDFEYTLNLLNLAALDVKDDELKQKMNDWLDYYRKISESGKL